jgi:hypothetical protein
VEIEIQVYIRDDRGGNLQLSERCAVRDMSFTKVAEIMSRVHDLFVSLKGEFAK